MKLPKLISDTLQSAPPDAEAADHAMAAPPATLSQIPDYPHVVQEESQWCWAAVAKGVALSYKPSRQLDQCAIATAVLGLACCNGADCDETAGLGKALYFVGHRGEIDAGPAGLASVRDEIEGHRPLCVRILVAGKGHFVAAYGYVRTDQEEFIQVADPANKTSVYDLVALSAITTNTYTTIPEGGNVNPNE